MAQWFSTIEKTVGRPNAKAGGSNPIHGERVFFTEPALGLKAWRMLFTGCLSKAGTTQGLLQTQGVAKGIER
jgi:hypothetical protein